MEEQEDSRRRGRPALDVKPIMLRLHPSQVERVDALRGDMSRAHFIRQAVENELWRISSGEAEGEDVRPERFVNRFGGITWREPDGTWRHKFINPTTGEVVYTLSVEKEPVLPRSIQSEII